jgi:chemotaxis protein CheC
MELNDKLFELSSLQLDALRETASIGAGNAATSLSAMLEEKIEMTVPRVDILPIEEVPEIMGGAEELAVATLVEIKGDISGGVLFTLEEESAELLVSLLTGQDIEIEDEISSLTRSALEEIANILTNSNLNAFSQMLGVEAKPHVPSLAYDMSGAILEFCFLELGQVGDYALVIETEFLSDLEEEITGNFFLIPDPESLTVILEELGVVNE